MCHYARHCKPATQVCNRHLPNRQFLTQYFDMHVAGTTPVDVRRWFDSMSATPANTNHSFPTMSVIIPQAELWKLRPYGTPYRKILRYPANPREQLKILPHCLSCAICNVT